MIAIVDTRYVLYRSHYAINQPLSFQGMNTNALFGLVRTLRSFRNEYGNDLKFILCHDTGIPQFRMDASNGEYKGGRNKDSEVTTIINNQQDLVQRYLPLPQWIVENTEADDLIASFCKHYDTQDQICIITNDKDIYSSLSERVFIRKSIKDKPFTAEEFALSYRGATALEWPLIKAIAGDKSDNLKGVPGYAETRASKFVMEGRVDEILFNSLNRDIVEANLKIVTPITSYRGWPEPLPITITSWNIFCNQFQMVHGRIDQDLKTIFSPTTQPVQNSNPQDLSFPSVLKNIL